VCDLEISRIGAPYIYDISHLRVKEETLSALYKESVRTALKTLSTTVIKTNQLMAYTAKVALYSEIRTKHSTQSKKHVEFLNVKPGVT
jgi:hypothetical protein